MTGAPLIVYFIQKLDHTYTCQRRRGKCNRKRKYRSKMQTKPSIFLLLTRRGHHQEGASLLPSSGGVKLFLKPSLLKPPSAQCPELPVGKVTRKNSTIKPTENQDTELSCDSQHSWLFNSTTKCHHLVKATRALSPTDTRNKKNLGFNN